jgi:transposase
MHEYFAHCERAEVLRQGYQQTRTARINALRGHLREFGVVMPVGSSHVLQHARAALDRGVVPAYLRDALEDVMMEIAALRTKAAALRDELERLADRMPDAERLMSVPGIGVLTATALIAFVGDVHRSITKRGNTYLRMILIHGARSALRAGKVADTPDDLRTWALAIERRSGHNVAAVALANKLARVCWRVLRDQRSFEHRSAA